MTSNLAYVQDPDRLSALRELNLLDTEAEQAFDRLTRLASLITNSPVSLVSLVDADRQFFKSFRTYAIGNDCRHIWRQLAHTTATYRQKQFQPRNSY